MKHLLHRGPLLAALLMLLAPAAGRPAFAQLLPSEPIVIGGGRLMIGGDVSATFSCAHAGPGGGGRCADDEGFFNYTDYEHSALRMLRIGVSAAVKAGDHLSFLGEVRSENGAGLQPYALYLRFRPWSDRALDIQAGRVPPTFGAFARRSYASDNLLIGYPLAYQYLTSLRPDSLPANADELLRMRGRGWLSSFSVGNTSADAGMALVSAFRWDTGVQVHAANDFVEATAAVTAGTLANPLVRDDNAGKQIAGRIAIRPVAGLILGASAARGPFVSRRTGMAGQGGGFTQTGWGTDVEYSRDYYLIRFEAIVSDWRLPIVAGPELDLPLRAVSSSVEGRYKLLPGLYAAARLDHLGFSTITGSTQRDRWEAPVTRLELGGGYSLQRNLIVKVSFQHNTRAAGRVPRLNITAAQLLFWI